METYYIYLTCFDGTTGYFTRIIQTSCCQEVGIHPQRIKAYKFDSKDKAFSTAKTLKYKFSCIKSYEVRNY